MKRIKTLVNDKRGLQVAQWMGVVVGIAGGVVIIAVLAIVLSAFEGATDNAFASQAINNSLTFINNTTSQLGTVGTIAGVLLLLGLIVVAGVFGYNKVRGM